MAQPYIGEIRMFAGNFPPSGWMFCQGQTISISENDTLFNLIGTTYGGDGQETFALPNLASRIPLHMGTLGGNTYTIGQSSGTETVTLSSTQVPVHSHPMVANSAAASVQTPEGNILAKATSTVTGTAAYGTDTPSVNLNPASVLPVGGSQPHDNMQPYLVINFIISMFGVYPSPS